MLVGESCNVFFLDVCIWQEMQQEVSSALAQRDPNLVLSSAFKLRITQRDLATLQEGAWLNDEVGNTPEVSEFC